MRTFIPVLAVCCCFCLTGCVGTLTSRSNPESDWVGKYPGEAIACDVYLMKEAIKFADPQDTESRMGLAMMSLPFDIAFDTIMLPVDLAVWPCGYSKHKD